MISQTEPDNTAVICPACCHQFRAIPVDVQKEIALMKEALRACEPLLTDVITEGYARQCADAKRLTAAALEGK